MLRRVRPPGTIARRDVGSFDVNAHHGPVDEGIPPQASTIAAIERRCVHESL